MSRRGEAQGRRTGLREADLRNTRMQGADLAGGRTGSRRRTWLPQVLLGRLTSPSAALVVDAMYQFIANAGHSDMTKEVSAMNLAVFFGRLGHRGLLASFFAVAIAIRCSQPS